jgi:hypothetical protein
MFHRFLQTWSWLCVLCQYGSGWICKTADVLDLLRAYLAGVHESTIVAALLNFQQQLWSKTAYHLHTCIRRSARVCVAVVCQLH